MDAVNALRSSGQVASSRVIKLYIRLKRWHLIAPMVEKYGCEEAEIPGYVILAATKNGKRSDVGTMMPFLAKNDQDFSILNNLAAVGRSTAAVRAMCNLD
jgi:hypothetical protein